MKKLVDRFKINPIEVSDIIPIRAGYQHCAPGWTFEPTCRESYTVQYVLSGCGTVIKDGQVFTVNESEAFILHPDERFQLVADYLDPWTYIWIGFRSNIELPELEGIHVFPAKQMENLFCEIGNCNKKENFPIEPLILSYIWQFLHHMRQMKHPASATRKKAEEYVEEACQLIQNYYATMNINQIADELHLNRSYLSRIFKQSTGLSLKAYLTNTKLQAARNLILKNHTVAQASAMVGYSDIASFSRAFKAYYKFPPKQYARLNQKNKK